MYENFQNLDLTSVTAPTRLTKYLFVSAAGAGLTKLFTILRPTAFERASASYALTLRTWFESRGARQAISGDGQKLSLWFEDVASLEEALGNLDDLLTSGRNKTFSNGEMATEDATDSAVSVFDEEEDVNAETQVGRGNEQVYVYTTAVYREKGFFKIGRSSRLGVDRIYEQFKGQALPEDPVIVFQFLTDNSRDLEKYLHAALSFRQKRIRTSVSSSREWFRTTEDEIMQLYNSLLVD